MKFKDPKKVYSGGYTSETILPNTSRGDRGVIQVQLKTGTVELQGKVDGDAEFVTIKEYSKSGLDEVVLAPYLRIIVSSDGDGCAWLSETN